jgi:multicomponent Na+:H+ antiporter subunit F
MIYVYGVAQGLLLVALLLTLARLIYGPSISDRVVALDQMAIVTVALIAVWVLISGETVFLDAAIMIGLLGFIGSVVFARYLERGLLPGPGARWSDDGGANDKERTNGVGA